MCRGAIRDAGRKIESVASTPSRQPTQAEFWGSSADLSPKLGRVYRGNGRLPKPDFLWSIYIYMLLHTHTELIEM